MLTLHPQLDDRRIDHIWPASAPYEVSTSALALQLRTNEKIQRACLCVILCVRWARCLSQCCEIPLLHARSWNSKLLLWLDCSSLCWFQQLSDAGSSGLYQPLTKRYEWCCVCFLQNCHWNGLKTWKVNTREGREDAKTLLENESLKSEDTVQCTVSESKRTSQAAKYPNTLPEYFFIFFLSVAKPVSNEGSLRLPSEIASESVKPWGRAAQTLQNNFHHAVNSPGVLVTPWLS